MPMLLFGGWFCLLFDHGDEPRHGHEPELKCGPGPTCSTSAPDLLLALSVFYASKC